MFQPHWYSLYSQNTPDLFLLCLQKYDLLIYFSLPALLTVKAKGWWFFSVKGRIVNILGFVRHTKTLLLLNSTFIEQKQPQKILKWRVWMCSNKTLQKQAGCRIGLQAIIWWPCPRLNYLRFFHGLLYKNDV